MAGKPTIRRVNLSTTPDRSDLDGLRLGDVVYLTGFVYTAREGVYRTVLEDGQPLPPDLCEISAVNFHCSPAAAPNPDGGFTVGAVTATASFRFDKWIGEWIRVSGARLIIGKGGMNSESYRRDFVPNGTIYLTTVGYGTGALLGRGIKGVRDVHWRERLGLAQAMWVLKVEELGPFLVESDSEGNSLFERENRKIAERLPELYADTRPAVLKRFGETDDRSSEII